MAAPSKNGYRKLKIEDVVFRDDLYPRDAHDPRLIEAYSENLEVMPPIEVNQRNELIDGFHRLKAHQITGAATVEAVVTETSSDAELLRLACIRNANHGYQLMVKDKQAMARQIYNAASDDDRPDLKKELPGIFSVTARTMQTWLSRIDKDIEAAKKAKAFDLWLACHTQEEIAGVVNVDRSTISTWIRNFVKIGNLSEIHKTAALFGDFEQQLYNVWKRQLKTNEVSHPGNSEQSILENLLHAYTEPFDVVVDPCAGGGSTIDVCKARFRRYHVSDLTPAITRENEIRQNDLTAQLPCVPRWNAVKLVYLDPPYWKQAEGWYGDSPSNLANMDAEAFHAELAGIVDRFAAKLQVGAKIAMLIQPTQWKAPGRGFVDHLAAVIKRVDLPIVQRVQCPYESQQATAQMVEWAKASRSWLVLSRELIVWEIG